MSSSSDDVKRQRKWERVKNLKTKRVRVQNLKTCTSRMQTAEINLADIHSAKINDAEIANLDIQNITLNGKSLKCILNQTPVKTHNATFLPLDAPAPKNVNQIVYDALIQNALADAESLQERIFEGRTFIKKYLDRYPCPPSCPPISCSPVPLDIYGALTQPVFRRIYCDTLETNNGQSFIPANPNDYLTQLTTAVNFNLQVDYLLEEAEAVDARVVSVLVQLGYIDPESPPDDPQVVITEVFIANKQFYPTLDIEYGENFANTINLPSNLLATAAFAMPDPNNTAAIQMVIYKEKGLCIWKAVGDGFECRDGGSSTDNPEAHVQTQHFLPCDPGYRPEIIYGHSICRECSKPCLAGSICGTCTP